MEKIKTGQDLYERSVELIGAIDTAALKNDEEKEKTAVIVISKKGDQLATMTAGTIGNLTEAMYHVLNKNPLLFSALFARRLSESI